MATPARAAGVKRLAAGGAARDTPPARAAQSRVFPRAPPRRAGLRGAALFFGRGRGVRRRHTSRALRSANLVNAARGARGPGLRRHRARARARRLLLIGHVSVGSSIELVTAYLLCGALESRLAARGQRGTAWAAVPLGRLAATLLAKLYLPPSVAGV